MQTSPPRLDVVLPVFNEAETLHASVATLHRSMAEDFGHLTWQITIADNASTDATAEISTAIAAEMDHVRVLRLPTKGRGLALKAAWLTSTAEVVAYMDIDLSTDLRALAPLVSPLFSGHSDIAIGSRLAHGSRVVRGTKREILSRGYNTLLHACLGVTFSDAQCGFKAMTARAAHRLLPLVEDDCWFFDTELLVLGERSGLRIAEVAVDWFDDPDSTVDLPTTIRGDLAGIGRLSWKMACGRIPLDGVNADLGRRPLQARAPISAQLVNFIIVGIVSTIMFSVLYFLFQMLMPDQVANFLALALSAVGNTMANRRLTFGIRDRSTAGVHLAQGLLVFLGTWALTAGALALAEGTIAGLSAGAALIVLTIANVVATILRFLIFRVIFAPAALTTDDLEIRLTRRELLGS